jgi:alpha-D-ribose 1-methylphosphonate 5-triphosphate synthase subunit PhnL
MSSMSAALTLAGTAKSFTMHLQGGIRLPVIAGASFTVDPGECVVLSGPSGSGKSSILKMIYGSYACDHGRILVRDGSSLLDVATAAPREILRLRRQSIGYVSQFLRAVPRVPAIDIVAEPLLAHGVAPEAARERARVLLRRLNIPERLWGLPPATFSGGEQQRVNIARGLVAGFPLLLLDDPTASLDAANRAVVIALISEKKKRGTAIVAVIHDDDARAAIADRLVDVTQFAALA